MAQEMEERARALDDSPTSNGNGNGNGHLVLTLDPDDPRPWERQGKETERQYEMFLGFRDQEGRRSIGALAKTLRISEARIREVEGRNRWRERVLAWDNWRQRERDRAKEESDTRMVERHARGASALYIMALRGMEPQPLLDPEGRAVMDTDPETGTRSPRYRPPTLRELSGAANVLDKAIHHERLAAGMPTNVTREDLIIRQEVDRVNRMVDTMMRILEEHLCDECRDAVLAQLRYLGGQARGQ